MGAVNNPIEKAQMARTVRILILGAAYGAGHLQAGLALQTALAHIRPEWETKACNFIEMVNPEFDRFSRQFYLFLVRYFPACYDWFYRLTDIAKPRQGYLLDRFGCKRLKQFLDDYRPCLVVATFPTPGRVAATLKLEGKSQVPVVMVITDHTAHAQWIHPGVDLYLVPDEGVKKLLLQRGVSPEKVRVTGIPIHPSFTAIPERLAARRRLGLSEKVPVVLLVGGGNGRVTAMEEMCSVLSRILPLAQIIVIAGKDREYQELLYSKFKQDPRFHFYGFVENMAEFMAAADLLVGKAGALTLAEAAAVGLPVIIYRCLPAQEEANALYYTRSGAALRVQNQEELAFWVEKILQNTDGIATSLRQAIRQMACPRAAFDGALTIAKLIEQLRV